MENNDAHLVQRILDGDENAFSEIVKRFQKQVHDSVWQKTEDYHIAEDITQDTFLRVYENLVTLKDPHFIENWIMVIAKNHCIRFLREKHLSRRKLIDPDITTRRSNLF